MNGKMELRKPVPAPYSSAVRADNLIFTSGHLPLDENGNKVEGGIIEQTHQVMKNLKATLEAEGSGLSKVVKATVLLRNRNDWAGMNEVYALYMEDNRPARTAITAGDMKLGSLLEIEVIARI
ncbi:MAG: RidA family protein [Clostridium sp.]